MRARLLLALLALLFAVPAVAQDTLRQELRDSRLRLEQIRREREQLQQEMQQLQTHVKDASGELANIERQVSTSTRALQELDFQAGTTQASIDAVTAELLRSRDLLAERTAMLNRRLRRIYEQGPMHSLRVLLGARSFGELLNRYKYLHLIALHDRVLVTEIRRLEAELSAQERVLSQRHDELEQVRAEKQDEVVRLQQLESRHQRTLSAYRSRQKKAAGRLDALERDARRLTDLVADLERRRKEEERRRAVAGRPAESGTITTRDLGSLRWPVQGRVLYRFGPERKPNGVVLRWNGIGIGADVGSPVKVVEAGTVVLAGPFEGYGPSVMVSHGGGYYTLYLYLDAVRVTQGQHVGAGDIIGTVGGARTPEGPHVEFQVRAPVNGAPVAVDPLSWLRRGEGS